VKIVEQPTIDPFLPEGPLDRFNGQ
jgi:hypothetical protein